MNNRIIVLDEVLASKIAAGEVIERPASVVKELIENSIDAGAKRVDIEIHSGGKALIRVTDDGSGMNEIDAIVSFGRHATSKIKNIDDLFNISTLGFRGEALPSIASVSNLEMITNDGKKGTFVSIEGGNILDRKEFACPKGTSVIVKDLFFNTPARRKFMRTDATEISYICDIVSKFIIGYSNISFKLTSNGREILKSLGSGQVVDSIAAVYGAESAKNMIKLNSQIFEGFVSSPQETKANRTYELFFVNKRIVQNHLLSRALENAYVSLIPKDKYPSAVIFLKIDPKEVDINVHPSKREIRLLKPNEIMSELTNGVREALNNCVPHELVLSQKMGLRVMGYGVWGMEDREQDTGDSGEKSKENILLDPVSDNLLSESKSSFSLPLSLNHPSLPLNPLPTPLTQIDNTFIICAEASGLPDRQAGLVLIDQHAAHERILYEKIKNRKNDIASQGCLLNEIIEFAPLEFSTVEENLKILTELGFDIEIFGKNTIRLKALPNDALKIDAKKLLSDIALNIQEFGKSNNIDDLKDKICKLTACHSAVKAGDRLNFVQMENLVKDLYSITNPATCPHGRPSVVKLDIKDIAKFFGR